MNKNFILVDCVCKLNFFIITICLYWSRKIYLNSTQCAKIITLSDTSLLSSLIPTRD